MKTPKLTAQQKAEILGDNLAVAVANGGHTLPLTALSRRTDVLISYFEKAGLRKTPVKGRVVLTFVV